MRLAKVLSLLAVYPAIPVPHIIRKDRAAAVKVVAVVVLVLVALEVVVELAL